MDEILGIVLIAIVLGTVTGVIGKWIAKQKGRSQGEGFWLGFLLSIFGLIIEGLLPPIKQKNPAQRSFEIESRLDDVFAYDDRQRRKCPFCAEMILVEARVCRYCQREVPLAEAEQQPSSNVLYLNEFGTAYHRHNCPENSGKFTRPIGLNEIPQGAAACSICNPPAAPVHDDGAQASTKEEPSPAKENTFLFSTSSGETQSNQIEQETHASLQTDQATHASTQTEQVEQVPAKSTCPSCGRVNSANGTFCYFCGKKLRT